MSNAAALKAEAEKKLLARQGEEARALFLQAAKLEGIDLETLLKEANALQDAGDVNEASLKFLKVIEANPTDVGALLGLARGALFLGMFEEAETYLLGVHRLDPENPFKYIFQGLIAEARQDWGEAINNLRKGYEIAPDEYLAAFNLGRLLAYLKEYELGLPLLHEATQLHPRNYDAWYTLGTACAAAEQIPDAVMSFNKARELAPKNLDIYATLADIFVKARDKENAISILNLGMNECGEHPALLEKAAAICLQEGKIGNAVEYFEKIVSIIPDYVQGWLNLANLYILTEKLDKSEAAAKKVIEINPSVWQGYFQLGTLYDAVRLDAKAEEAFRKGYELAPLEAQAIGSLGSFLIQLEGPENDLKVKEGISLLQKTLPLAAPGDWRYHYNLALAFYKLGDKSKARHMVKEIDEKADPKNDIRGPLRILQDNLFSAKDQVKTSLALSAMMGDARKGSRRDKDEN